jgi:2-oxo-4-hydroxy-4-carboxy-5-ureidoimidazoline decarboxylase
MKNRPSQLTYTEFMQHFAGIYEHSPWVAEAVWLARLEQQESTAFDYVDAMAMAMRLVVENSSMAQKLALLQAHPDLAGKAALAGELTRDSSQEQASAGLDSCTQDELAYFNHLNSYYRQQFGFPFIMAVKGASKQLIIEGFESRIGHSYEQEFALAMQQVHKIALFRLQET